ncbi:MAG: Asp-tRNA(Asn)/Glu-tRNA(Gln) amidotransferase subunit GatB [Desulfovibrio sp.]|nr:Asp-tRNA(Asn)/Glu-tRNA(Gln) amidotransferase subunit GatB [Desulfovibrio sp.]
MPEYEAVIGLEVHVHLATASKLFCSCSTRFGSPPNTNVCEICSAMPGALPTPNRRAIRLAALVGLATGCQINTRSVFARKNYFYPDLPAGYQISQFELPICEHGHLDLPESGRRVGITRIHLENDAGKNIHSGSENISFVDLNRAGIPLIEIVSEPDMRSAAEAAEYLRALHGLVTYLGASDGNMEEGSFRCDANVSIRPAGSLRLGTRTELKNLNSFRNVQRAIEYEIARQEDVLAGGGKVIQETRLFDAAKNRTAGMRGKEEAQDYRYFPDPDLLPVEISEAELEEIRASMPELPAARRERFLEMTGLPRAEVETLLQSRKLADFFEEAARGSDARKAAAYIIGPLARVCNAAGARLDPENWKFGAGDLAELINITNEGLISAKIAADICSDLLESPESPREYVLGHGLGQISDAGAIEAAVDAAIASHPEEAAQYRAGKKKVASFFVGLVMRETKGKANPGLVNRLLAEKLGS